MQVGSDLELFSTLFGWRFYGQLWDILTGTGLAFLPFLGFILSNVLETHVYGATEGPVSSLRRMDIEIAVALTVVVLAGQPTVPLASSSLSYTTSPTATHPLPSTSTPVTSPTTFRAVGFAGVPGGVTVPIWWYAAMSASHGIVHAGKMMFSAGPDLRGLERHAQGAAIQNPVLRQETNEFYTQCYLPAKSKYLAEKPTSPTITALLASYGNDDPNWVGSHVYLSTPGYYDQRAAQPVKGWPYSVSRDTEYANTVPPPTWGKPTCTEWWTGLASSTGVGLKQKLINEAGTLDTLTASVIGGFSPVKRQDAVARAVLNGSPPEISTSDYAYSNTISQTGPVQTLELIVKSAGALIVGSLAAILQSVVMHLILSGLTDLQALTLMGMYAMLPLIVVISGYKLEVMVVGALAIFTVIFWTFLWDFARWTDQYLIAAFHPTDQSLLSFITKPTSTSTKRLVLDMITSAMYLGLPMLWTAMMAWVGYSSLSAIGRATDQLMNPINKAGNYVKNPLKFK